MSKAEVPVPTDTKVKTTPQNVEEANQALFAAKWNLPKAAKHCGMSDKEMKLIFWEFLKYNPPNYVPEDLSPEVVQDQDQDQTTQTPGPK